MAAWAAGMRQAGGDRDGAAANRRAPRLYPSRRAAGGAPPSSRIAPMRILALDTSTEWCSVAVGDGARWLRARRARRAGALGAAAADGRRGAGRAGWTLGDLDGIAFGAAPARSPACASAAAWRRGSALGARSARGPGVPTLEALARCADGGDARPVACLDARMREVYVAAYRAAGGRLAARSRRRRCWRRPASSSPAAESAGRLDRRRQRLRGLSRTSPRGSASRRVRRRSAARRRRPIGELALPRLAAGEGVPAADGAAAVRPPSRRADDRRARRRRASLIVTSSVATAASPRGAFAELAWRPLAEGDLAYVAALEAQIHAAPWTVGNFRDALAAGYCGVGRRARGPDRRLRGADAGARRGADPQPVGGARRAARGAGPRAAAPLRRRRASSAAPSRSFSRCAPATRRRSRCTRPRASLRSRGATGYYPAPPPTRRARTRW